MPRAFGRVIAKLGEAFAQASVTIALVLCLGAGPGASTAAQASKGSTKEPPVFGIPGVDSAFKDDSSQAFRDSARVPAGTHKDTLPAPKSRSDSIIVVKHSFDHREQIITGSVVMACLMLMMVTMNNYNPR